MSFLKGVGHAFTAVFGWLGSSNGQKAIAGAEAAANAVATAINPGLGAALVGVEMLINAGLKQVVSIETVAAAAGAQDGTGPQKLAAVVSAITPNTVAFLESIGVAAPTAEQVQTTATAIANGLVSILNVLPAPKQAS